MKLGDPFPSAGAFKTLLCSFSNKGRLQKLIFSYLTELAQNVDAEIVYCWLPLHQHVNPAADAELQL